MFFSSMSEERETNDREKEREKERENEWKNIEI
jgi:hypothetical protein